MDMSVGMSVDMSVDMSVGMSVDTATCTGWRPSLPTSSTVRSSCLTA